MVYHFDFKVIIWLIKTFMLFKIFQPFHNIFNQILWNGWKILKSMNVLINQIETNFSWMIADFVG
jgi:hypothetical protein